MQKNSRTYSNAVLNTIAANAAGNLNFINLGVSLSKSKTRTYEDEGYI